jgi:hypothetical protein
MKTPKKIDAYFNRITGIRYENEHGGAYAYIQYLAFSRELLTLLRPFKSMSRHMETIEGINWLFNEHLAFRFTHRHKLIFDEKLYETRKAFEAMRAEFESLNWNDHTEQTLMHAQAA